MEFAIDKCVMVDIMRGNKVCSKSIHLRNNKAVRDTGRVAGTSENSKATRSLTRKNNIWLKEVKEKVTQESFTKLKITLKMQLNAGNTRTTINTKIWIHGNMTTAMHTKYESMIDVDQEFGLPKNRRIKEGKQGRPWPYIESPPPPLTLINSTWRNQKAGKKEILKGFPAEGRDKMLK